jgi:hypothetical protein
MGTYLMPYEPPSSWDPPDSTGSIAGPAARETDTLDFETASDGAETSAANPRRMKLQHNVERLMEYLQDREPTTVARMAVDGVLNSRDASDAVQYGIRLGVLQRIRQPGMKSGERVLYRLTGQPLRRSSSASSRPSFDALLSVWGIRGTSLQWPDERTKVVQVE